MRLPYIVNNTESQLLWSVEIEFDVKAALLVYLGPENKGKKGAILAHFVYKNNNTGITLKLTQKDTVTGLSWLFQYIPFRVKQFLYAQQNGTATE